MNKITAKVSPCSIPSPTSTSETSVRSEVCVSVQELGPSKRECRCWLRETLRLAVGMFLAVGMAMAWVWASHTAKKTLTHFNTPFFVSWFCNIWNLLMFPLYYTAHLLTHTHPETPTALLRGCVRFLAEDNLSVRTLLKFSIPFSVSCAASWFLYFCALSRTSLSDCSALMCCSSAFTFLLTWTCLKERFLGTRVVAVIVCVTGIVILAYSDGFYSNSISGIALGVGSASCAALYNVLYRKRVGTLDPGAASVVLCSVGVCAVVLHSWVCVLLYITHLEFWPVSQPVPWNTLCTTASLLLVFNVLVNMGGVCTYHVLITLGFLFTVPVSAVVDVWLLEAPPLSDMRLAALCLISVAFVMLKFPEDWDEKTLQWISSMWRQKPLNT